MSTEPTKIGGTPFNCEVCSAPTSQKGLCFTCRQKEPPSATTGERQKGDVADYVWKRLNHVIGMPEGSRKTATAVIREAFEERASSSAAPEQEQQSSGEKWTEDTLIALGIGYLNPDDANIICKERNKTLEGKIPIASKAGNPATQNALNALWDLQAFVGEMFGIGPNCIIPEKVATPLGVDVKLGDIMRDAERVLSESGTENQPVAQGSPKTERWHYDRTSLIFWNKFTIYRGEVALGEVNTEEDAKRITDSANALLRLVSSPEPSSDSGPGSTISNEVVEGAIQEAVAELHGVDKGRANPATEMLRKRSAEIVRSAITKACAERDGKLDKVKRVVAIAEKWNDDGSEMDAALSCSLNEAMAHDVLEQTEKERDSLSAQLAVMKEALEAHHRWHSEIGSFYIKRDDGSFEELNLSLEYPESSLGEQTTVALAAFPVSVPGQEGIKDKPNLEKP